MNEKGENKNQPYNYLFSYRSITAVESIFTSTYVGVTLFSVYLLPVGHRTYETPRKRHALLRVISQLLVKCE